MVNLGLYGDYYMDIVANLYSLEYNEYANIAKWVIFLEFAKYNKCKAIYNMHF